MNAHFFGAKRAYYATLRFARPVLARFGLTPARFDLLTVLRRCHEHRTWQSELRKALGVAAATVSRMVRALEELGLVARSRSEVEKRQVNVRLTDEGLSRVDLVHDHVIDPGHVDLAVDSALGDEWWFDWAHCLMQKDAVEGHFTHMRKAFGDGATLHYPWHPED